MEAEPTSSDVKKLFPANLEVTSGGTLYKVTSVYADKGDFRALWESLIVQSLQANMERKAS